MNMKRRRVNEKLCVAINLLLCKSTKGPPGLSSPSDRGFVINSMYAVKTNGIWISRGRRKRASNKLTSIQDIAQTVSNQNWEIEPRNIESNDKFRIRGRKMSIVYGVRVGYDCHSFVLLENFSLKMRGF